MGGPCDFGVSPSPFALDFGTLDFGTSDSGLTISYFQARYQHGSCTGCPCAGLPDLAGSGWLHPEQTEEEISRDESAGVHEGEVRS